MKKYRVRPHTEGGPVIVRIPGTDALDVPNPAMEYDADHPLVDAYPWLFREFEVDDPEPIDTETTTTRTRATTRRKAAEK